MLPVLIKPQWLGLSGSVEIGNSYVFAGISFLWLSDFLCLHTRRTFADMRNQGVVDISLYRNRAHYQYGGDDALVPAHGARAELWRNTLNFRPSLLFDTNRGVSSQMIVIPKRLLFDKILKESVRVCWWSRWKESLLLAGTGFDKHLRFFQARHWAGSAVAPTKCRYPCRNLRGMVADRKVSGACCYSGDNTPQAHRRAKGVCGWS